MLGSSTTHSNPNDLISRGLRFLRKGFYKEEMACKDRKRGQYDPPLVVAASSESLVEIGYKLIPLRWFIISFSSLSIFSDPIIRKIIMVLHNTPFKRLLTASLIINLSIISILNHVSVGRLSQSVHIASWKYHPC